MRRTGARQPHGDHVFRCLGELAISPTRISTGWERAICDTDWTKVGYTFSTFLHEIGHAVGRPHISTARPMSKHHAEEHWQDSHQTAISVSSGCHRNPAKKGRPFSAKKGALDDAARGQSHRRHALKPRKGRWRQVVLTTSSAFSTPYYQHEKGTHLGLSLHLDFAGDSSPGSPHPVDLRVDPLAGVTIASGFACLT